MIHCFSVVYKPNPTDPTEENIRNYRSYLGTITPYQPGEYANHCAKFLYYRREDVEILLVGRNEDIRCEPIHSGIREAFQSDPEMQIRTPSYYADGAGTIKDGRIIGWVSRGQRLDTPEELKPRIRELLQLPE